MNNNNIAFWASLVGAIVVAFIIAIWVPGEPNKKVVYAIAYGGLVITFLFGFIILVGIARNTIDISSILEGKGGPAPTTRAATLSRCQLLSCTFAIALSVC